MGLVKTEWRYGVLVLDNGHFDSRVRWTADKDVAVKQRDYNVYRRTKEGARILPPFAVRKLILNLDGFVGENSRWDFGAKAWTNPTQEFGIVDTRTMGLVAVKKLWPDAFPELPDPLAFVDKPLPPKEARKRGRKFVYDPDADAWVYPRRVGIVNAQGVVVDVALEHPAPSMPDVKLPPDHSRFDERDWPTRPDGTPVGIKDVRNSSGKFDLPQPQTL